MITDYLPVDPMVILAYALAALTLVIAAGPGQGLVLTQTIESGARASLLTSLALQTPLLSRPSRSNKAKPTSIHNWLACGTRRFCATIREVSRSSLSIRTNSSALGVVKH